MDWCEFTKTATVERDHGGKKSSSVWQNCHDFPVGFGVNFGWF